MKIEHIALNVKDPAAMAQWYCVNLGMKVLREGPPPVNARFIADSEGATILEIYNNPPDAVPDYASMDPLLLHIAFSVDDVATARDRLLAAGGTAAGEVSKSDAGDTLAMVRDPWGLVVQLMHRTKPLP